MNSNPILSFAKKSLQLEYEAVGKLFDCIDKKFEDVLKILHNCPGRIIITGVRKSGLIAQKIVATLNSTGTYAVNPHAVDIMTPNPFKMKVSNKAVSALRLINQNKINHLVVCDDHEAYLGFVHILDFAKEGLKDE